MLDFGCGGGRQGAALVVGLDTNPRTPGRARALAAEAGIGAERLRFHDVPPDDPRGSFGVVVSQNALEHVGDPAGAPREMRAALAPGGRVVLTFGPPRYAPSGSHMHFFTRVPWVNPLFSERTVMAVRARYRADGARRYEQVESGLDRMTVGRFERMAAREGPRMESGGGTTA